MDPYKYLFSKLQLRFEEHWDTEYYPWEKQFRLYYNSEYICSFRYYQTVKELFLYLNDPKILIDHWITEIIPIVKLLRQFPRDLESKEHVDLLLTLNGLNK